MASPPNFKISPGMSSGPTDFFFPIAHNCFLILLIKFVEGYLIMVIEIFDYYFRSWIEMHKKICAKVGTKFEDLKIVRTRNLYQNSGKWKFLVVH